MSPIVVHIDLISLSTVFIHRRLCTLQLIAWDAINSSLDGHCRASPFSHTVASFLTASVFVSPSLPYCCFFYVSLFPRLSGKTCLYFSVTATVCLSTCPSIHTRVYLSSYLLNTQLHISLLIKVPVNIFIYQLAGISQTCPTKHKKSLKLWKHGKVPDFIGNLFSIGLGRYRIYMYQCQLVALSASWENKHIL